MIGSELDKLITDKEWTLNDILEMDKTVEGLVQELIDGMNIETKYSIVKDQTFNSEASYSVGEIISIVLRAELSEIVSVTINEYLKTATVNFSKGNTKTVEVVNKEKVDKPKKDKLLSLKEQIKKDVKQLDNKEMKKKGMI